jgi:hypothetical protein
MDELYQPDSDFVALAAHGHVPLEGNELASENLEMLVAFTRDDCKSNRDFAVMALGMYGPLTKDVLKALLLAADDPDLDVRGEAIEGVARRNAGLALPLVRRELGERECGYGVFIAAGIIADQTLVDLLKTFDGKTDASWVDDTIRDAIHACSTGIAKE